MNAIIAAILLAFINPFALADGSVNNKWALESQTCSDGVTRPQIVPSALPATVMLDFFEANSAVKSVIIPDCSPTSPILDAIFSYDVLERSTADAEVEWGTFKPKEVLSLKINSDLLAKCDQSALMQIKRDLLTGNTLEKEMSRKYSYFLKGNVLRLVYKDPEVCRAGTQFVILTFVDATLPSVKVLKQ